MTPVILICGQAGSGKDTVAAMIAERYNGVVVAQADVIKRFANGILGFTQLQLWGASENRSTVDVRWASADYCRMIKDEVQSVARRWVIDIFSHLSFKPDVDFAVATLLRCVDDLFMEAQRTGGMTARKTLQVLGTEFGRTVYKDLWASYARDIGMRLLSGDCTYNAQSGLKSCDGARTDVVVISDGRFRNEIIGVKSIGGIAIQVLNAAGPKSSDIHRSESEQLEIPGHFFDAIIHNDKQFGLDSLYVVVGEAMEYLLTPPQHFQSIKFLADGISKD